MRVVFFIKLLTFFCILSSMQEKEIMYPHDTHDTVPVFTSDEFDRLISLIIVLSKLHDAPKEEINALVSLPPYRGYPRALSLGTTLLYSAVEHKIVLDIPSRLNIFANKVKEQLELLVRYETLLMDKDNRLPEVQSRICDSLKSKDQKIFFNTTFSTDISKIRIFWKKIRIKQLKKLKKVSRETSCCEHLAYIYDDVCSCLPGFAWGVGLAGWISSWNPSIIFGCGAFGLAVEGVRRNNLMGQYYTQHDDEINRLLKAAKSRLKQYNALNTLHEKKD